MQRRIGFVLILLSVFLMALCSSAMAQGNCQAFRAIGVGQALSPYQGLNTPLPDIWGGEVYASLGSPGAKSMTNGIPNSIPLIGKFSGADADDYSETSTTLINRTFGGMGVNGAYTLAFGTGDDPRLYPDKFTVRLGRAIWNFQPGQWVGDYQASGHISRGTGIFEKATGNFTLHGPFFFGSDPPHWTPEVEGTICGVQ